MFCCAVLCVRSTFAFILMGKRELAALLCLDRWTDVTYRTGVLRFLMVRGHCKFMGLTSQVTPQAHFNPITPYCTNPNLTQITTFVTPGHMVLRKCAPYMGLWHTGKEPDKMLLNVLGIFSGSALLVYN